MQLVVCGLGGAGSRLADALVAADRGGARSCVDDSVALDTDKRALAGLESIPTEHRHLYGALEASGRGFAYNRRRAAAAADEESTELFRAADDHVSSRADAILLCVGLAGASGSTLLPTLAAELREVYELPIYGLGVLPGEGADNQERLEANAGAAIEAVADATDALLMFDNALWTKTAEDDADPDVRARLNEALATRVTALFTAGEADADGRVAESVVDASELINTLDAGGIAALGYATQEIERPTESRFGLGLFEQDVDPDETAAIKAIETTVRRAVNGKLTVEADRGSVSRGLLVTGGPPEWLNRRAISDARSWLAQETGSVEIRGGDLPEPGGDSITMVVLLAGVRSCRRIDDLRAAANRD